jgi:hypothetical protein
VRGKGLQMAEVTWALEPDDIEWIMTWKDKPSTNEFEDDKALAHLLMNEVVFLNSHWSKYERLTNVRTEDGKGYKSAPRADARWTKAESELIAVYVNCNDVFAWGCADAEDLPHDEIENLYRLWRADPHWGSAKWCAIRRKQQPQKPVIDAMKAAGSWDDIMENLGPNTMDAEVSAYFRAMAPVIKAQIKSV